MSIKVYVNISPKDVKEILVYYNSHKNLGDSSLDVLDCNEGGFKLIMDTTQYIEKYRNYGNHSFNRQLRWKGNMLVSYFNYPTFELHEKQLLFRAMCYVLGRESVKWFESYSSAVSSSPETNLKYANLQISCRKMECSPKDVLLRSLESPEIRRSPVITALRQHNSNDKLCDVVNNIWSVPRTRI